MAPELERRLLPACRQRASGRRAKTVNHVMPNIRTSVVVDEEIFWDSRSAQVFSGTWSVCVLDLS
jgi:hypothetical protein